MVAAGALVTSHKRVAERELWAGVPARKVREVSERDLAASQNGVRHYVELAQRMREESDLL